MANTFDAVLIMILIFLAIFLGKKISKKNDENSILRKKVEQHELIEKMHDEHLKKILESNITAIPYLAGVMADFLTYDIEQIARRFDYGASKQRMLKVEKIREIRQIARERIEKAKIAIYQMEYLKSIFPFIEDYLDVDYREIDFETEKTNEDDIDPIRNYLSRDEWMMLSESDRNQKALDNYIASHKKSKWQIGRDYEQYIGHIFRNKGHNVDHFGAYMGFEDLGRDLIAKNNRSILIIQCKYWSKEKIIHEKHIFQLYGTLTTYQLENNLEPTTIKGYFVTNTRLSDIAKKVAELLNITVWEDFEIKDFPRIKCNIDKSERIYHLPMDQQYDRAQIKNNGEFYAYTVVEAESRGFRRAYRWYGMNEE